MKESTEERVQRGLETLATDIKNWIGGKKQTVETIRDSVDNQLVTNIINNYTTERQSVKFGFMSVLKIIFLVVVIFITAKILLNPMYIVESFNWIKQVFHSI